MRVKSIRLADFRNIRSAQITPCETVNVILGENAQGKTNLLEAVWLCTGGRSFRGAKEGQMVRMGEKSFCVDLGFCDREREQSISYRFGEGKKKIALNGVPLRSPSELGGEFYCVVFDPTDLSIVKDGPEKRRAFIDTAISQIKPVYGRYLSQYQSVLEQRNALIRDPGRFERFKDTLDIWDEQLAKIGTAVSILRSDYLTKLGTVTRPIYSGFTGFSETLGLCYQSSVFDEGTPLQVYSDSLIEEYKKALLESREADLKLHYTTKGIHRDDLLLSVCGLSAKNYGSQGQQRSIAVALKLGEAALLKSITGENPVVLLDDVMSELDPGRQDYILNRVEGFQVFITCCDISNALRLRGGKVFLARGGEFQEQEEGTPCTCTSAAM